MPEIKKLQHFKSLFTAQLFKEEVNKNSFNVVLKLAKRYSEIYFNIFFNILYMNLVTIF